ncbi:endonuclease III [Halobacteriales archaeon QS_9_70_65]|nr:MAG: endonuclease III [Halobacteriales archaeon QS_9_70_65]
MDEEPTENIGSDSGTEMGFEPATADTRAGRVVDRLGELYWRKHYGGRDAFECLVRTVLSQNTADTASQRAHDALMGRYGGGTSRASGRDEEHGDPRGDEGDLAAALADARRDDLAETISPAGLQNQKAETLVRLAGRVREEYGDAEAFDEFVAGGDPGAVREALLEMTGVGPKTADCVLLFAGGQAGVFPVDTHVHCIARRIGLAPADADHETVREHLEAAVRDENCGFGHTATIQFGREYCTARDPACLEDPEACPMADLCDKVGVSPETGAVVDPAEAPTGDD